MDNDLNRDILITQDSRTVTWFPVSSVMCLGAYIVSKILSEYSYEIEIVIFVVVFLAAAFVENSIRHLANRKWTAGYDNCQRGVNSLVKEAQRIRDLNEKYILEYIDILEQAEKKGELDSEIRVQIGMLKKQMRDSE